jgi:hypothetical protein
VYNNGTIFIQGCMALYYASEVIQPMLSSWLKTACNTTGVNQTKYSDKLKNALKNFRPPQMAPTIKTRGRCSTSPITGASNQFLNQIFSSFVESCFFYWLLVIFTNLYDRDIKSIRKV